MARFLFNTLEVKTPQYADVVFGGGGDVDFDFTCGFDFNEDRFIESIVYRYGDLWGSGLWDSMMWGGNTNRSRLIQMKGSGKFVQFF